MVGDALIDVGINLYQTHWEGLILIDAAQPEKDDSQYP
jgi:hypothetical protein